LAQNAGIDIVGVTIAVNLTPEFFHRKNSGKDGLYTIFHPVFQLIRLALDINDMSVLKQLV